MLDECKGEKFDEVLAAFSTLVLRKTVANEQHPLMIPARRLATAPYLSSAEQTSLLPLAIAHRASLTKILRDKARLRAGYQKFDRLLDVKEEEIMKKSQALKPSDKTRNPRARENKTALDIQKLFDIHWQGDPNWKNIILDGGEPDDCDTMLDMSFSELRPRIIDGTLNDLDTNSHDGLLQDLDRRVKSQEVRLQNWKSLREDLSTDDSFKAKSSPPSKVKGQKRSLNLSFGLHTAITTDHKSKALGVEKKASPRRGSVTTMIEEYEKLIKSMQNEMDGVEQPRVNPIDPCQASSEVKNVSQESNEQNEGAQISEEPIIPIEQEKARTLDAQRKFDIDPTNHSHHVLQSRLSSREIDRGCSEEPLKTIPETPSPQYSPNSLSQAQKAAGRTQLYPGEKSAQLSNVEPVEEIMLADQIISSTLDAGPSPANTKLALIDRTRKSMAMLSPQGVHWTNSKDQTHLFSPTSASNAYLNGQETLQERTRQSMSHLPSKSRPYRKSAHPYSTHKSYPTNPFETPEKTSRGNFDFITPPEELFSQDANYASVFKSRPKIATSPSLSPMMIEYRAMAGSMNSYLEEDGLTMRSESSPLARAKNKAERS